MLNILTVDLEEWYHPEYVRKQAVSNREDKSADDLKKTFELLENHSCTATFFVLGEIAAKHPELTKQIRERRHEVAFHGYDHERLMKKTFETMRLEIDRFRMVAGDDCVGFRAPSFSLNNNTKWLLDVLEEKGFKYDSSIFPASTPLYGMRKAPLKPYKPSHADVSAEDEKSKLWEFPLHIYSSAFMRFPMAGGFYLRFFPLNLIVRSIRKANKLGRPAVVFIHTWELNPETPRLKLGFYRSFVTYHNLEKTTATLDRVLSKFEFTGVQDYMKENGMT